MKYLKSFEDVQSEEYSNVSDIVKKYCSKYPEFSSFFREFADRFDSNEAFKEVMWNYLYDDDDEDDDEESDDDDDEESDDERYERLWDPDSEVYMLEQEIGNYPGSDIWVDFWTDMDSAWEFQKTPLGVNMSKYNV